MFENHLPLSAFDIVNVTAWNHSFKIEIEARRARLSDNPAFIPSARNVWRYIRDGSNEDNQGLLGVNLGPIFSVRRGQIVEMVWINELGSMPSMQPGKGPTLVMPPVNPLPMDFNNKTWETMNPSVGIVTHLHGGKVKPDSDGWPLDPVGFLGNPYGFPNTRKYIYPNDQRAAMLWFHDHAMDNTSIQVHAGLAGLYFIRDSSDDELFALIGNAKKSEIPLVIQDRMVDCGFDQIDYWAGVPTNTDAQGQQDFSRSEYLGETIFVDGRAWPTCTLSRKTYRLRVLNGSNARTYALALIDPTGWANSNAPAKPQVWHSDKLTIIGNDGGLLGKSVKLDPTDYILLSPGERLDLLLDLTAVEPAITHQLRLVNLAVASAAKGEWPEAIFQTVEKLPTADSSILGPLPEDAYDNALLTLLSGIGRANIMQICVDASTPVPPVSPAVLDAILSKYAKGDGFSWNGSELETDPPGHAIAANRFILLMNDTEKKAQNHFTKGDWRDTQMWELAPAPISPELHPFEVPFAVDLVNPNPPSGSPSASQGYYVSRSSFFEDYPALKRVDEQPFGYAKLNTHIIKPKAGTYERWYVANLGDWQPKDETANGANGVPDLHPFHMHLVNFVVTKRWRLNQATNQFESPNPNEPTNPPRRLDLDGVSRHDTVRVQSNELLELLVWFPPGYIGEYPYHCHIVEHEDMGMMSTFKTV
jgi:FtsP/CotA-like multicopper oxidase with cupredoxin domain